ncbi:Hypothetical protein RG1141_CH30530 [Neorhizobium galegae bv. officinalis bv. officinalis str. HAMBI 1141]|uniref:Transmembrane protein n=1 Tax=Neorhizobium galegae bv. officinalis bv. officinalis str. HAMBI 1141 TaxID=1028801 RepID=A0A068TAE1_NEOGA|nr:hypothetical protein [Neorhizobium galegae]CDN55388.1 Hypothetical protein RG1141_CH30530 [Neorhizobium galegae bv. officinalis bv. officinalis str. HAMBI 1141]
MEQFGLMAIAVVAAVIGGAIAAKLAGIEIWKGALIGACASVAGVIVSSAPGVDRNLSIPMAGLIAAGISGSAVGLTPTRTAQIAIGAALPPLIGFMLMEMGA